MDKRGGNGAEAESQGDTRDEPTRSKPLAAHVCWDLTNDVRDVEDRQDGVVVVALRT